MKYSFIVPVYNGEKYIQECLDSLLNQSFTDFEVIIADDGSTDNSGVICDQYASKDSRIKVFHNENRGVSEARNFGIDNSAGEYICFVDCDDTVSAYMLECANTLCDKYDVVMFGYTRIGSDDLCLSADDINAVKIEKSHVLDTTIYDKSKGAGYNCSTVWAKIYRRDVIKDIRFNKSISIGEDKVFNFSAFLNCGFVCYCDKIMYYCRTHDSSVMQRYAKNYMISAEASFSEFDSKITSLPDIQHYKKMLSLRALLIMKNIVILELCNKKNKKPYSTRKSDWHNIKESSITGSYFKMCDNSELGDNDKFFYHVYSKHSFFRINLMTKNRLFKAVEYTIYKSLNRR